jgi:hypothetical protein
MKRVFVLACSVIFFALVVFSFTQNISVKPKALQYVKKEPISCNVFYNYSSTVNFFDADPYHASKTRKNIFSLSAAEINKLKNAIAVMKSLPVSNKTSWAYQVGIHGGPSGANIAWGTCQHNNQFFLAWHRMYIYFFERILRSKMSGTAASKPALPYWDYQLPGQDKIPSAFTSPASAANSLYDVMRDATMNTGGSFAPSINIDLSNAMSFSNFFTFQNALNNPHSAVHIALGKVQSVYPFTKLGDMNNQLTASNDPLFWIHHANVDRLWESWLQIGGSLGNATSANTSWWNKEFIFFDEKQNQIKMKGSQIVNVAANLHYKYDRLTVLPVAARVSATDIFTNFSRIVLTQSTIPVIINGRISNYYFENMEQGKGGNPKGEDLSNIYIEFENLKTQQAPSGIIEVYVNPRKTEGFEPTDDSFVGLLDLFSNDNMDSTHVQMEHGSCVAKISVEKAIKAQNLRMKDVKNLRLVFLARGNYKEGSEVLTTANIFIAKAAIVQYLEN